MGQIESSLLSIENNTMNANQIKELVLGRLNKDGLLTDEHYSTYTEKWQIIIIKTNWFEKFCNKFGIKKDVYQYKYVNFID